MKQINNEDCFKTIGNIAKGGNKVGLILTSPPFILGRELQETLDMNYLEKYRFLDSVLGYKAISK